MAWSGESIKYPFLLIMTETGSDSSSDEARIGRKDGQRDIIHPTSTFNCGMMRRGGGGESSFVAI